MSIPKGSFSLLGLLVVKYFLCAALSRYDFAERIQDYNSILLSLFALLMLIACCQSDPVVISVVIGSFGSHALSIVTATPMLYLLGNAFVATLLQGVAHALSREQATIFKLQDMKDSDDKLSYEWSHVCYFPNLVTHAVIVCWSKNNKSRKA